jgi:hypothetical protein
MVQAKLATSGTYVFSIENQNRKSEDCYIMTKTMQFHQVFLFIINEKIKKQLKIHLLNRVINDTIKVAEK